MLVPRLFVALAVALAVSATAIAADLTSRKNTGQGVTVTVTPMELDTAKPISFKLVLDTHSQDLTDDVAKSSVVVDSTGRRYEPIAWEGAAPGGHHREGLLRFSSVEAGTAAIELHLQRVGESAPRVFRWSLQ
jgi:hypothetical protein